MKTIFTLLSLTLVGFYASAQKLPPLPKHDSISFKKEDSVYKYFRKGNLVLWRSYRTGSMSYLPGQAIGGGYDSAYLYFQPGKWVLYTFEGAVRTQRTLSPYSLASSVRTTKNGRLLESGTYLLRRESADFPQWLNMRLRPVGVWMYWNRFQNISKRINYDTVFKVSAKAKYNTGSRDRILQAADSLLRAKFGDSLMNKYVRLNAGASVVRFRPGNEPGYSMMTEYDGKTPVYSATLTYELRLNDSLRFDLVTLHYDSLARLANTWTDETYSEMGIPSNRPQARYLNRAYLLKRAASYGIKNDHRIFWNVYHDTQTDTYKIECLYLLTPDAPHAEAAIYKQLLIDAATGKESFSPKYQVQFETVMPVDLMD